MYWFINSFDLLMMLVVFSLDSSGIFRKKLFMISAYGTYFYFTMIPCELALSFLPSPYRYIFYSTIRVTMYALLMLFWLKKGRVDFEKATDKISPKQWGILCIFSVSAILCVTLIMTKLIMLNKEDSAWDFIISVSVLLIIMSAYFLIIHIMKLLNEESENRLMRYSEQLLHSELEADRQFVEIARQNRHDIRHHIHILQDFLNENKTNEALSYIEKYDCDIKEASFPTYCENVAANAFFRRLESQCKKAGVALSVFADIPASLPLSETDTCVLLGNIFENAFEASRLCKDAHIKISAKQTHKKLCLSVCNSVFGTVQFKNDLPISDRANSGVGIQSILRVLGKCNGMITFTQESGEFVVQVIVPLE